MAEIDSCRHNILYLSHGGGPLPLLGDKGHREMVSTLQEIAGALKKPSAVIVISAHWEASVPTIMHGDAPELLYDYSGFPYEAYEITYPAPGAPALAEAIYRQLKANGIEARLDDARGFDHGLFVPLKIMYPDADILCVQLSLVKGLNPAAHMAIGRTLASLPFENLLIVGSGFAFHNMQAFFSPAEERDRKNTAFQKWLVKTCSDPGIIGSERTERLQNWEHAPFARYCHPREEHLLPLHVCYGVAGRACDRVFSPEILGVTSSMFLWNAKKA